MIAKLLSGFVAKALAVLAVLAAIGLFLARIFTAGKTAAREEGQRNQLGNVEKRNEVERDNARLGGDAVRDRLRDKWTRD